MHISFLHSIILSYLICIAYSFLLNDMKFPLLSFISNSKVSTRFYSRPHMSSKHMINGGGRIVSFVTNVIKFSSNSTRKLNTKVIPTKNKINSASKVESSPSPSVSAVTAPLSRIPSSSSNKYDLSYQFIDSGNFLRLERFGLLYVIRSCPSAYWERNPNIKEWHLKDSIIRYNGTSGKVGVWKELDKNTHLINNANRNWTVTLDHNLTFLLNPSDYGQIGVFCEQLSNWKWITQVCQEHVDDILKSFPDKQNSISNTQINGIGNKEKDKSKDINSDENEDTEEDYGDVEITTRPEAVKQKPTYITDTTSSSSSLTSRSPPISLSQMSSAAQRHLSNLKNSSRRSRTSIMLTTTASTTSSSSSTTTTTTNNSSSTSRNDNNTDIIFLPPKMRVLNAFAYTGGSTMAAARVNRVEVVHLDSSKSVITTAFKNAYLSGYAERPIRYIIDDCTRFIDREISRKNKYDGLIFDPPAFGRASKSGVFWKLDKDLPVLVSKFTNLLSPCAKFVLLSCHDPDWPGERLAELLSEHLPPGGQIEYGDLMLSPDIDQKHHQQQSLPQSQQQQQQQESIVRGSLSRSASDTGAVVNHKKSPALIGTDLPLGQFARWYMEYTE